MIKEIEDRRSIRKYKPDRVKCSHLSFLELIKP